MASTDESPEIGPVLVTGGCGFIGSHIVEVLLERDPSCQVHVIDINTQRNKITGANYHQGDVASASDVSNVFNKVKPRTIFHVACPESTVKQDETFRRVNIDGARNMLEAARQIKTVRAFINTSTSSVIHDNHSDLVEANEDLPVLEYPAQKRVYTLTKAKAEAEILAANGDPTTGGMLTVSMWPALTFGERDGITTSKIIANARQGKGNVQIGHGKNLFDCIYVTNLVDAHILAAEHLLRAYEARAKAGAEWEELDKSMRVDGQCFIVTNGERMRFWDFHRAIAASVGLPVRPEEIRIVPVSLALLFASISEWYAWLTGGGQPTVTREAVQLTTIERTLNDEKVRRVLGYRPRYTIAEGLEKSGKWYVEEEQRNRGAS